MREEPGLSLELGAARCMVFIMHLSIPVFVTGAGCVQKNHYELDLSQGAACFREACRNIRVKVQRSRGPDSFRFSAFLREPEDPD